MLTTRLETLRKVLILERDKGYKDTAVSGGLDRFLIQCIEEVKWPKTIQPPHDSYANKTFRERELWIDSTLKLLGEVEGLSSVRYSISEDAILAKEPSADTSAEYHLQHIFREPVSKLSQVSSAMAAKLSRLGVQTIQDLLYFFPRSHNDFGRLSKISELRTDGDQTIMVNVWEAREVLLGGRHKAAEAIVGDNSGNLRVIWFNQPYLARQFKPGIRLVLSGKPATFNGSLVLESPEYEIVREDEDLIHTGRLVPVYPLTNGLSARTIRRVIKVVLDSYLSKIEDHVPGYILKRLGLLELSQAVYQAHYPDDEQTKADARRRLAFDELFMMQLYVFSRRREWREASGSNVITRTQTILDTLFDRLPFSLTNAQERVLNEVLLDMSNGKPMSRLIQGDVGSGKTAVALAALLVTVGNGYQGAFMAPTEILAKQHFDNISILLQDSMDRFEGQMSFTISIESLGRPISVGLLIGSHSKTQKRKTQEMMAQGNLDIIIGTHALAQSDVQIPNLALAVVDEQHRFGVMQRAALRGKGETPHFLVMSATPIPRSLALTLYGDLDISVLDELPPGRQVIETRRIPADDRSRAYDFVREQTRFGRQALLVCPLIEESDILQTRAAVTEFDRLSNHVFPDLTIGLLHGRMSFNDKERVMARFHNGELDILVSTPVVEVGIDNPNATVIVIEGADRFGLAQLHQFRGRVGRGKHMSYCLLLSDVPSKEAIERLRVMERISNGFLVAEEDLKFRGPGDFFGTRQSGLPDLKMARLSDQDLLASARREASDLFKLDPELAMPTNKLLAEYLEGFGSVSDGNVS